MVNKVHTVVGTTYPTETPPSIGAHFVTPNSFYLANGDEHPENWVQIWGEPNNVGISAGASLSPGRMVRAASIYAGGQAGPTAPLSTLIMPAWGALPYGMAFEISTIPSGVTVPVDIDFSAVGPTCSFEFVGDMHGITALQEGAVLKLQVTEAVAIAFHYMEWNLDGDIIDGIYVSMRVTPIGESTAVEIV